MSEIGRVAMLLWALVFDALRVDLLGTLSKLSACEELSIAWHACCIFQGAKFEDTRRRKDSHGMARPGAGSEQPGVRQ